MTSEKEQSSMTRSISLLALVLLLGLILRGWMAISTPLIYDEYQWIPIIDSVRLNPLGFYLPLHGDQHPPGQVYWSAFGTLLFGHNLFGYRFVSVALGTVLIFLVFLVARDLFDTRTALLAASFAATNEYLIGGVSRLCTEKSYLTFALLALLLFLRVTREPTKKGWMLVGLVFGLGMLTKQTLMLWLPIFFAEMLRRRDICVQWRTASPWLATGVCLLAISPDLYWNLTATPQAETSNLGIAYQVTKLGVGDWSWGPTALFLRFLIYPLVDPDIQEYPAMTFLPGGILLLGAIASLFLLRTPEARFLQVLGWAPFLFFSLLGNFPVESPAFWWADLSVVPFIILTAGVICEVTNRFFEKSFFIVYGIATIPFLIAAIHLASTKENVFVPEIFAPPQSAIDRAFQRQRLFSFENKDIDHFAMSRFGSWCLPVWRVYAKNFHYYVTELQMKIDTKQADTNLVTQQKQRIENQLRRFDGCEITPVE
jgi:hypothetical protein